MGLTPADFFTHVHFAPLDLVPVVLGAAWYGWSVGRLRRRGGAWPAGRPACFAAAAVAFAAAACSGLDAFARSNFSAFGAQFVLAGLLAPVLLAFSAPVTLALQSSTRPGRGRWLDARPARWVAGPLTTWLVFSGSVLTLFFTGALTASLHGGDPAEQAVLLWMLVAGT